MWPGFGENMRVLKWIVDRVCGRTRAMETSIGWIPRYEDFHWDGLDYPREDWDEIMEVDREKWKREVILHEELFIELSEHLPKELLFERELLICRL